MMRDASPHAIHVTLSSGRADQGSGIRVHRSPVDPRDVRSVDGVPCTSPDRVLVDLAPRLAEPDLEQMLVAAESRGTLKRGRLAELVARAPGPPRHPQARITDRPRAAARRLRARVALPADLDARPACPGRRRAFRSACRVGPSPFIVDVAWPDLRLVVELDSQRFHGDWVSAERDRERDQLLALAGWLCHRFVRRRAVADEEASAERLRRLYVARAAELPTGTGLQPGSASPARRGSRA